MTSASMYNFVFVCSGLQPHVEKIHQDAPANPLATHLSGLEIVELLGQIP